MKNCLEAMGRQFLPRDIKMSRKALWVIRGVLVGLQIVESLVMSPPPPRLPVASKNVMFFNVFAFDVSIFTSPKPLLLHSGPGTTVSKGPDSTNIGP